MKIIKLAQKHKLDLLAFAIVSLLSPLYFYKLSQSTLVSWDEAWYADIARNILERGNFFTLWWNGMVYSDHPPAGFWIMAFFQSIFGVNEFGSRIGSAIFGMTGLYFTYLLGKEIFSRTTGFLSALALSSTYWYLYRARSGNLDIFLAVFFILSFYFAIKAVKNSSYLIPFVISFGLLILTKSLIPLTLIPALLIIFWGSNFKIKDISIAAIVFSLLTFPWFVVQYITAPNIFYKYFKTGAPGVGKETDYMSNFKQIKEYLHFGLGKWFWPGALGVFGGLVTGIVQIFASGKYILALSIFCLSFFAPFLLSDKGQIWHLIPLYPFMVLAFFGFLELSSDLLIEKFLKKYKKVFRMIVVSSLVGFCIYLIHMQIKRSWYEFIDIPKYITDEAILSKEAGKFPFDFYIDGADFTPVAVFYSHKKVGKLWEEGLAPLFNTQEKFVLITHQWRLDKFDIPKESYEIIAKDRDKILVIRK